MKKRFWVMSLLGAALFTTLLTGCGQSSAPSDNSGSSSQSASPTQQQQPQQSTPVNNMKWSSPPKMSLDQTKQYYATIHTNEGDIEIQLYNKQTPVTVNNFVFLSEQHFYNGVPFHRIVKDFMIQTGDPTGTGTGGPGYQFKDELPPVKPYAPGVVAMANAGPNTNGSQFFIGCGDQVKQLNSMPNYTVFGQVVKGMDVVQKIADTPVKMSDSGEMSKPTQDVHIDSVSIEEK